jgi:hypothetical protein
MEKDKKKIWFPAKKYGWGWGPPCCWQGWVVIAAYVAVCAGSAFLLLNQHPVMWGFALAAATIALMVTGFIKGEKPRWRWGGD